MRRLTIGSLMLLIVLLLAACAMPEGDVTDEVSAALEAGPAEMSEFETWENVLAAAEGTTVNWFMWGGSDTINAHVDERIGQPLQARYGIDLNRVPLDNTADAVNKVLNERTAGKNTGGSIDVIWINGENFRTMKEGDLLYGPFVELLPNGEYVNWDDPAVNFDFGTAVDGYESPWASFQWVLEYNEATVGDTPPTTFEDLRAWIEANPGRFTYPAPPNHVGNAFIRQLFYWTAGEVEPFLGEFDQAYFDEIAPEVWAYLNEIKPNLWRNGETYPELAAMTDLLANQEIDFNMEYDSNRASTYIAEGLYPETIRTAVLDSGTVANVSYVAIPYNANNPAGAMILANFLLSPDYQVPLTSPAVLGWKMAIDPTQLSEDEQAELAATELGIATLPADVLSSHALPEVRSDWAAAMEAGWVENVLK